MLISTKDPRLEAALKRLAGNSDFLTVLSWMEESLALLDKANRSCQDGILLRQHQGAALAVAEYVARAKGEKVTALTVVSHSGQGPAR